MCREGASLGAEVTRIWSSSGTTSSRATHPSTSPLVSEFLYTSSLVERYTKKRRFHLEIGSGPFLPVVVIRVSEQGVRESVGVWECGGAWWLADPRSVGE